jgi:hypothetical protein
VLYTLSISHPWLEQSCHIWRRVRVIRLFVMQFSPSSYHFIRLDPYILLKTLFSNTFSVCISLNIRDQVSHPYKTTGKL